ncbi:ABC transporter permease [Candidatus Woesearchaeota archaeon]|nr:ABC transporter permease [Candidatus Woesearchaeota archaeon]
MTNFISLQTIVRKETTRFFRIWTQTLLPSVVTMALYFVIFGHFIGSRIEKINGFSYIEFIVPGLIMMAVITNSYSNVVSSFFGAKFQRSIEEILVSPTPAWIIIFGYCLGGISRGLVVGILVTIVALFFTKIAVHSFLIIIIFLLLTTVVFSLMGLLNGIFAKKFDDVAIVPTFVLTPLTYLGGVFYSVFLLPDIWKTISLFNPIFYMVNGFRYGFLGYSDTPVYLGFFILLILMFVLFLVNLILIKKGVGLRH